MLSARMAKFAFFSFILLLSVHLAHSRSINEKFITFAQPAGADGDSSNSSAVVNELAAAGPSDLLAASVTCEPTYGFLPCTTQIWGQLFLIVVYQYLLSVGGRSIGAGSTLFFQNIGPGVVGGSIFQVLGTIPQIILVLATSLSGSPESAAQRATMGMGFLVGSTIMLLTLIWGAAVAYGRYDLSTTSSNPEDTANQQDCSLLESGINTDVETSYTARIMFLSLIPFLILQLAKVIDSSSWKQVIVLVSLVATLALLVGYILYQAFQPWVQNRTFEYLMRKHVEDKLLDLVTINGRPYRPMIEQLFYRVDRNKNGFISREELRLLILGIQLEADGQNVENYLEKVMGAFDSSGDDHINQAEFVRAMEKYVYDSRLDNETPYHIRSRFSVANNKSKSDEQQPLVANGQKTQPAAPASWFSYIQAAFMVVFGTGIILLLAEPLIRAVAEFSTAAKFPQFVVPYIVIPIALNFGRAQSVFNNISRKSMRSSSLTLSQIYGSVFMNHIFGLTVFLTVVYVRDLAFDVSAEALVVLVICIVMGIFTSTRTTFPLWTSIGAILLYPISLALLYFLTVVLGWA